MATKALPEGKELPVESDVVRPLVRAALETAIAGLRGLPVKITPRAGYTVAADGEINERELAVPGYERFHPDPSARLWTSPAATALTDYLWSRSVLKLTITNDHGEPTREAWASFTWSHLVLGPLRHLAKRAATEDLTLRGEHVQWRIDADELDDAVVELVGLLTGGSIIVSATCPVIAVDLDDDQYQIELEPGVVLAQWAWQPEQVVFMTRHGHEYRRDEGAWNSHVLRLRLILPADADPVAAVASVIDRVKWALMVADNRGTLVHELAAVVQSATGHARDVLRRGSPNFGASDRRSERKVGWVETKGWSLIQATPVILERVRVLLSGLAKAMENSADFSTVMWAFGRSCVAPIPRDALLDAVVGLERLVVPGEAGDSTYRFRLHGQAVLTAEGNIFNELRDLYSLRSAVAHGGSRRRVSKAGDVEVAAPRARLLLAKAIHAAVTLLESGELKLGEDGDVSAAVADLVRARVSRVDS